MSTPPFRICVFCGSSPGRQLAYTEAAAALAGYLAQCRIPLVYGGANVGLMKTLADTVLAAGGEVIGVIPQSLATREVAHPHLTELHTVGSMHERKALMADLASAFIAMPGGYGTLDEFCEILTWAQLGLHHKPCAIFNVSGFYDGLLQMFDHAVAEGFVKRARRDRIIVSADPVALVERLRKGS